ncbi:fungal-specific transcription factor domain-containing protein [Xylariaceae sp. FL0016]|nr:fungal-specific transcription factor domain-containing protein [Xylariaceae sp. FL0016]
MPEVTYQPDNPDSQSQLSRRRPAETPSSSSSPTEPENRRKLAKTSRACDTCKIKKARCSGTLPCSRCVERTLQCVYNAKYSRGRPPTPPPARLTTTDEQNTEPCPSERHGRDEGNTATDAPCTNAPSELDADEIAGQYIEPTSGFTFLHRAHKRLSVQQGDTNPHFLNGSERLQPLRTAGDRPLHGIATNPGIMNLPETAYEILVSYFNSCVVTYRMFYQLRVMSWLETAERDVQQGFPVTHRIGNARAAALFTIVAIVNLRTARTSARSVSAGIEANTLSITDQYFSMASALTDAETGLPQVESAQSRLVQVLYLLQTSRMNSAWYLLGSAYQIVVALGLHRRARQMPSPDTMSVDDYIELQCQRRVFWVAYTIDAYLSVVLGRPRYFHDQDINQEFPASVNDEDMAVPDRSDSDLAYDSEMDAVIAHAQLARIIGTVSRDVYSISGIPARERHRAAQDLGQKLKDWRDGLPPHLGTIHPSSLVPNLRRQAVALKLAYCHAIIHAKRPFLLDDAGSDPEVKDTVRDCIQSAKMALQTIVTINRDRELANAFWWAPYVTFCALAVIHVWNITQGLSEWGAEDDQKLVSLTEQCHSILAQSTSMDYPSHRYTVILEELRQEARTHWSATSQSAPRENTTARDAEPMDASVQMANAPMLDYPARVRSSEDVSIASDFYQPFRDWQTTDWLDLDASVSPLATVQSAVAIFISLP